MRFRRLSASSVSVAKVDLSKRFNDVRLLIRVFVGCRMNVSRENERLKRRGRLKTFGRTVLQDEVVAETASESVRQSEDREKAVETGVNWKIEGESPLNMTGLSPWYHSTAMSMPRHCGQWRKNDRGNTQHSSPETSLGPKPPWHRPLDDRERRWHLALFEG